MRWELGSTSFISCGPATPPTHAQPPNHFPHHGLQEASGLTQQVRHAASGLLARPLLTLANCVRRLEGSREVVSSTLGSTSPACAYSSSTWLRAAHAGGMSTALHCQQLQGVPAVNGCWSQARERD
jgi:hypothetical protein